MAESVLKDFYKMESISGENGKFVAEIILNKEHNIFNGHFPNNPVTPGVCMMQIIKEITEEILKTPLFLQSASNIKFMAIINPNESPKLQLNLDISEDGEIVKVKNVTSFGETIALKLSATYKKLS